MEHILDHYRNLAEGHAINCKSARPALIGIDKHVAASLLQKAIRRSETELALLAASRLLDLEPARFWRRLITTLFEDVGIADRALALTVLAAAPNKTYRRPSWPIIANLVQGLCDAPKTQIANHLIHLAQFDPDEFGPMDVFDCLSFSQAAGWIERDHATLVQKCRAAWLLSGLETYRRGKPAPHPNCDLERLLEALENQLGSIELAVLARVGIRHTRNPLPLAAVLETRDSSVRHTPDQTLGQADGMPRTGSIGGVPNWVFDQHTRVGKKALALATSDCKSVREALSGIIGVSAKQRCLSSAHFEFEGARLANRLQKPEHLEAWRRVQTVGAYRSSKNAQALYEALETDWGCFEEIRSSMICEAHFG